MRTIGNVCNVEARCIADLFRISLAYVLLECRNGTVLHEADRAAAKAGTSHAGTNDTILLPGQFSQRIQLFARNIIVIAQGEVGIIHELAELLDKAGVTDVKPGEFKRYGSARKLYNFNIDNADAY